jgi:hypothetical protein
LSGRANPPSGDPTRDLTARDGYRFESPQLHQVVRASWHDFLRRRIARHFRSLPSDFAPSGKVKFIGREGGTNSYLAPQCGGTIDPSAMTAPLSAAVPSNARRRRSGRTQAAGARGLFVPIARRTYPRRDESRVETGRTTRVGRKAANGSTEALQPGATVLETSGEREVSTLCGPSRLTQ